MAWFSLNPGGNPTQPNDYTAVGSPSCSGTNQICAVQTTANASNKPNLTSALKDEMIIALHSRTSSANVQLKA